MIYPFFSDDMTYLSPQMPMLYLFAFCTAMLVFVTLGLIRNGTVLVETDPSEQEDKGPAKNEDIPLLLRLSEEMRGTLIRVSVQDHLVEVYTDKGMSRLRMRLRDALKEIPEDLGLTVHRSHWVSRDQVRQGQKSGGKITLQLEDGSRVPVSRSCEAKVRAEGWL
ncbi:LytTR family DNA-binding domain-containing protein [Halocynthiibacter sp.]|uniref:LytTR family DNA-binding domain-containing protein n=1 Tax=Halocynthiibacter sp. TaxID=1979210 RepID=UPI003C43A494